MKKRLPLTEDPAFRDLNWDLPLNSDTEEQEWDDEQE